MGILREFIQWLPEYFFPKVCYGCKKEGVYVCDDCRKTVERALDQPRCPECGKEGTFGATHPGCRRRWGLDGLVSYYKYAGWAKEIIKEAKFGKHHRYAAMKELAEEMALAITAYKSETRISKFETNSNSRNKNIPNVSNFGNSNFEHCFGFRIWDFEFCKNSQLVIVPIPLHWWREFKRGFNQAELIAGELSEAWKIPLVKVLIRRQYTEPQTLTEKQVMLTKEQEEKLEEKYRSTLQRDYARKKLLNQLKAKRRRENIEGAFKVNSDFRFPAFACHSPSGSIRTRLVGRFSAGRQISDLQDVNVLLIDDVWTTGATVKECCRVLKLAGVKRAWGITLLRA